MNKKTVTIVLVVLLLLCTICAICLGVTYAGAKAIFAEGAAIREAVLDDICLDPVNMTMSQYEASFTESFQAKYSYTNAIDLLKEAFPASYDCSQLLTGDVFKMLTNGEAVSISTVNGKSTAQITFNNGTDLIVISLEEVGSDWKISDIEVSTGSLSE